VKAGDETSRSAHKISLSNAAFITPKAPAIAVGAFLSML